jgi:hypothetical protein
MIHSGNIKLVHIVKKKLSDPCIIIVITYRGMPKCNDEHLHPSRS